MNVLFDNNSNAIYLCGERSNPEKGIFLPVTNALTGAPVTGGTATVHLRTLAGEDVPGEVWPRTMAEMATPGVYRVILNPDLGDEAMNLYRLTTTLEGPEGEVGTWEDEVLVTKRGT